MGGSGGESSVSHCAESRTGRMKEVGAMGPEVASG